MNGSSLVILGILALGIMPTLGFFSPGSAFILLFLLLFIFLVFVKGGKIVITQETVTASSILLLLYAAFYYGGYYQPPYYKAVGQIVFFAMAAVVTWTVYVRKHSLRPSLFIVCYVVLGLLTLATSPHPHVDTVVVFREAPLKLLQGINPYDTMFSPVYNNIKPDYYNHLPLSFIFYIPFVLLPIDERLAVMLVTIGSFYLLYRRIPAKQKQNALLPLSLILFMPGSFYMLEHMYHDSMIFFFFSCAISLLVVSERLYYLFLSLFFTVKQNLFIGLPFFISRRLFRDKNWLYFLTPFLLILVFFLWNPAAFLNDTLFGLQPSKITSPINISLTFPTLVTYLLPFSVPASYIRNFSLALLVLIYLLFIKFHTGSPASKIASVLFASYFFSYYAFFNSYYLVLLLFLYDFIRETYFPALLRAKSP